MKPNYSDRQLPNMLRFVLCTIGTCLLFCKIIGQDTSDSLATVHALQSEEFAELIVLKKHQEANGKELFLYTKEYVDSVLAVRVTPEWFGSIPMFWTEFLNNQYDTTINVVEYISEELYNKGADKEFVESIACFFGKSLEYSTLIREKQMQILAKYPRADASRIKRESMFVTGKNE